MSENIVRGNSDPTELTEEDVEGASLKGCPPTKLLNQELKFWLQC